MRVRLEKVVLAGDGTRLYARETRDPDGAPRMPMICANGIAVSTFWWPHIEEGFSPQRPVILWDYRGHGQSEYPRDLDDLTIDALADDMARVLDAFGRERAIVLGHSMGCQVTYAFAHRHPERAALLVPMQGTYGHPIHSWLDSELPSLLAFTIGHRVGTAFPNLVSDLTRRVLTRDRSRRVVSRLARLAGIVHQTRLPKKALDDYLDHLATLSPLVFFRMAEKMATHSADGYLEEITAPTLVVAGEQDIFTPLYLSEVVADRLPVARLLVVEQGTHTSLMEQPDLIHAAIEAFIEEHQVDGAAQPVEAEAATAR